MPKSKWDAPPPSPSDEDSLSEDDRLQTVGEPIPFSQWSSSGSSLDPFVLEDLASAHGMSKELFLGVLLDSHTLLYQSKVPGYRVIYIPAQSLGTDEPSYFSVSAELLAQ